MSRRTHSLTLGDAAGGIGIPTGAGGYSVSSSSSFEGQLIFHLNGQLSTMQDGITTEWAAWLSNRPNTVDAALYEIRRTQGSGVTGVTYFGTMTSGVWYPLNADRGVYVQENGTLRFNISTWDIRLIGGDGTILATYDSNIESNP